MDQFGTPPSTHKRRTKMWVAIILLDLLLTGAVVYYIFFRPEPTPNLNVKTDQQVQGEPIDVVLTDNMDAVEEKDPLIALMDQLLEETADVEDLEVSAEQRINISKPEHAKYTPLIFEDIGNWDPNKNQQSPDEPIKIRHLGVRCEAIEIGVHEALPADRVAVVDDALVGVQVPGEVPVQFDRDRDAF